MRTVALPCGFCLHYPRQLAALTKHPLKSTSSTTIDHPIAYRNTSRRTDLPSSRNSRWAQQRLRARQWVVTEIIREHFGAHLTAPCGAATAPPALPPRHRLAAPQPPSSRAANTGAQGPSTPSQAPPNGGPPGRCTRRELGRHPGSGAEVGRGARPHAAARLGHRRAPVPTRAAANEETPAPATTR